MALKKEKKKKKKNFCVHLLHGAVSLTSCSPCWSALSLSAKVLIPPTARRGWK